MTALSPRTFEIGSVTDQRLRVNVPIPVVAEKTGKGWLAEAVGLNEFGWGEGWGDAVEDLRSTIGELYWILKENQHRLGPEPQRIWDILRTTMEERP